MHTPLPVVLGWAIDELLFWHHQLCLLSEA